MEVVYGEQNNALYYQPSDQERTHHPCSVLVKFPSLYRPKARYNIPKTYKGKQHNSRNQVVCEGAQAHGINGHSHGCLGGEYGAHSPRHGSNPDKEVYNYGYDGQLFCIYHNAYHIT